MKYCLVVLIFFLLAGCAGTNSISEKIFKLTIGDSKYYLLKGMPKKDVLTLFEGRLESHDPVAPGYVLVTTEASYEFHFKHNKLYSVIERPGMFELFEKAKEINQKRNKE